jgi:uncharacterized membrane protein
MLPKTIVGKVFIGLTIYVVTILAAVGGSSLLLSIFNPHVISSDFIISLARAALSTFTVIFIITFLIVIVFYRKK